MKPGAIVRLNARGREVYRRTPPSRTGEVVSRTHAPDWLRVRWEGTVTPQYVWTGHLEAHAAPGEGT